MGLSKKEIEKYKEQLIAMRGELVNTLEENSREVKSPDESKGYSQHQADEGTDDFNRRMNLQINAEETETLKLIDRALEKIEEGTYGICDISGKPINKKRLDAIPYAIMTVEAKEELEKSQGGY
jgi:DnaK suppressor protein